VTESYGEKLYVYLLLTVTCRTFCC